MKAGVPVVLLALILLIVAGCYGGDNIHEFAVSVRNESGTDLRVRVFVPREGPFPGLDIVAEAHSDRRDGAIDGMAARVDNSAEPVQVVVLTMDCTVIQVFSVSEGRTLLTIAPDLTISKARVPALEATAEAVQLAPVCQ